MAAARMTVVAAGGIPAQQPAHERGNGGIAGLQQQMEMIGNEAQIW